MSNHYHFVTRWRMEGEAAVVYDLLTDPLHYERWWRGPMLKVQELKAPDERGLNQTVCFQMKGGRLPNSLKWEPRCIELNKPYYFVSEVNGGFFGKGAWTFKQDGAWVDISFDWDVRVQKPAIRYFSFLLRLFFVANHNWVMRTWQESLHRELIKISRTGS